MMFMIRVEFYMHKGASKRPYNKRISVTVFRGILHANLNIILLNNRRGQELVGIPWNDELHSFYIFRPASMWYDGLLPEDWLCRYVFHRVMRLLFLHASLHINLQSLRYHLQYLVLVFLLSILQYLVNDRLKRNLPPIGYHLL